MKTKFTHAGLLSLAAAGLGLVSGCVVQPYGRVEYRGPRVVVAPPVVYAPAVVVEGPVMVPESYIWDGGEYIGFVGGQYFYLGAGNVWLVADGIRLERFHGYERGHPDWRNHATRNDHFRKDAHGREHPMGHGEPEKGKGKAAPKKEEEKR